MTEFWQMQRDAALTVMDFLGNPELKRVSRELADLRDSNSSENSDKSSTEDLEAKEEIK